MEKELTGREEEPSELIYFKVYKSQIPVIEQAIETAARMLGTDKSRGYCLEMICADFLAGAHLDNGNPTILLNSLSRYYKFLPGEHFGKRAYALRSAYHLLDAQLPSSAVLQSNPYTQDLILHMLYSGHDSAAGDGGCGTDFGGDAGVCAERLRTLVGLFRRPDGSDLDATCQEYGIDALVVEDADPVWREPSSWVWSRRPIVANDYVRVFRCGAAADSIQR